ncbi:MAG: hypothetical protein ACWGQW_01765 [bacterium]
MSLAPYRILSIDWDYVTGDCAEDDEDGPHPHCGFCKNKDIARRRGKKEHLDTIWEEKEEKLLKLRVYKGTPIFVAECHANIMDVVYNHFDDVPDVFDYDSHRDKYDQEPYIHCGNWIHHLERMGGRVDARPRNIKKVGAIFICRSSPWTPRCMDDQFYQFVQKMAEKTGTEPQFIGHRMVSMRNGYRRVTH